MPNIENTVSHLAQYFYTIDFKSAYHQIPQHAKVEPYTDFQFGGQLFQFTRMLFGVNNVFAYFQKEMDEFFKK